MRLNEILIESKGLDEAPMGMLKRAGLGLASKFSSKATGKLALGNEANEIKKDFNFYIGSTKQTPTAEVLLKFLKQEGHPTASAEKILKSIERQEPTAGTASSKEQPAAVSASQPKAGTSANAADSDYYEKYKSQIRQTQSQPGAKPLPQKMAAGIEADLAKLAKGDKESGSAAAQKILNFAQRNMDVDALAQKWLASSKAGERFLTQSVFKAINNMLKEHGLKWADLGLRVRLNESVRNKVVYISLKENTALSNNVIDQVLTAVAQDIFKSGSAPKTASTQSTRSGSAPKTASTQSTRSGSSKSSDNQTRSSSYVSSDRVIDSVKKLTTQDKQELLDFLKKNDRFNKLKF